MPAFVFVEANEKEATIKQQRVNWQGLKTKHDAAIKAAKVSFSQDLGKYLDNRASLWKAVHDAKPKSNTPSTSELSNFRSKLNALKTNGQSGHSAVASYFTAVRKLNVAATKTAYEELERALVTFDKLFLYDESYADSMGKPKK